jgi:membrane-associated phospholipid phosphatase
VTTTTNPRVKKLERELQKPPEVQAEIVKELEQQPEVQERLRRLTLRRIASALTLVVALSLFLLWLPPQSRRLLVYSIIVNRFLIVLLGLFGLTALSLLWSEGQRLDLWLFQALNLGKYRARWLDWVMFVLTQIGTTPFALVVAVGAYLLGNRQFAIDFALGSLSLLLLVTIIKAFADRTRPYKFLKETNLVGWREPGLSFPSGHTTQTFFMMSIINYHFELPFILVAALYIIAALVGFTRVYVGVHYPRDVIAGAILGLMWGTLRGLVSPYF